MKYLKITAYLFLMSFVGFAQDDDEKQKQWNYNMGINFNIDNDLGISGIIPSFSAYSPKGYYHRVDLSRFGFNIKSFSRGLDFRGQYTFGKRLYEKKWFSFDLGILGGLDTYLFDTNSNYNYYKNVGLSIGISPQFNFQLNQRLSLTTRFNLYHTLSNYSVSSAETSGSSGSEWKTSSFNYSDLQLGLRFYLFK